MTEQPRTDEERRFASQLRSELDAAVRPFDPAVIVRRAGEPRRPVLRLALAATTIAAAVVITLAATQLPSLPPSMGTGPDPTQEHSPPPSRNETPSPPPDGTPSPSLGQPVERALPSVPPPDEQDLRELGERYMLDAPPQDVEFERYISQEEFAAVRVPCLTEQGIGARALADGGVGFDDIPEEQWVLQREAVYRCEVRFPTHPMFDEPLTDDQLRALHGYLVNDLKPCLEAEGYTATPPPTVEVFIAAYRNANQWTPWPVDDPRLHDMAEWDRLSVACPQVPPFEVMYGDAISPDGD